MGIKINRVLAAPLVVLALTATAAPLAAQDSSTEARLRKAESEIRALQRKVFPGGDGKFFEPEVTAQTTGTSAARPSTTAVTDILARLDALEGQLARLTSQTEENSNAIQQLTTRLGALEVTTTAAAAAKPAAADANLGAMTGGARPTISVTPTPSPLATAGAVQPRPTPPPPTAAKPSGPTAQRLAAVQAIPKPQTGDAGEDEYNYGFRLWEAKFFPEAQQQLSLFVEKHPRHARISYGRNLLGRAYLDDGKTAEAARWFLANHQANPQGERAPDSLLYLAETMIAMKDTRRACIALATFSETYPAVAGGRLRTQYEANRAKVKCN